MTLFPGDLWKGRWAQCEIPGNQRYRDCFEGGVRYRYVRTRPYRSAIGLLGNMLGYRQNVCHASQGLPVPDVIVGSCVHPWAVDAAMTLAHRFAVPFVYQIRDIWPKTLLDAGIMSRCHPLYWVLRRLELRAFRESDGVVGVMPGVVQYAEQHGVPAERIAYVPNGADIALYPEPAPPPATDPFVVSYFGSHGPPNALDTVLHAAAHVRLAPQGKDIVFRLVGDGEEKPRLIHQANEMGLENVQFLDPVPKKELHRLAAASHMFVFAHPGYDVVRRYGLSCNKLFDYLLAARPVAFAADSLNDPIAEAGAGLSCPAGDASGLARNIVRIRSMSADERQRMGRQGRDYALKHHDLRKLALRLEQFLTMVVACRKPNSASRAYETAASRPVAAWRLSPGRFL